MFVKFTYPIKEKRRLSQGLKGCKTLLMHSLLDIDIGATFLPV